MKVGICLLQLAHAYQIVPVAPYAPADAIRRKIGSKQPISATLHRSSREMDATVAFTRTQDPLRSSGVVQR